MVRRIGIVCLGLGIGLLITSHCQVACILAIIGGLLLIASKYIDKA